MHHVQRNGIAVVVAVALLALAVFPQQVSPDLILFNGKIFTSDAAHPYVQALAIRGERIVATGDSDKIKALAGPQTTQIDLGGRTVIPGINDAHIHLEVFPANKVELQFDSLNPTWTEVKKALAVAVATGHKGALILAYIGPVVFTNPEVARGTLDKLAPDHPVFLASVTGHAFILNSRALAMVGIQDGQADPVGGRYEKSADGKLTGVVREYAALQITRNLADLTSDKDAVQQLRGDLIQATKFGITSLQDMSQAIAPDRCVALLAKAATPVRIRVIRMPLTSPSGRDTAEARLLPHSPAPLIAVSGTKWVLDGTPVERTFDPRDEDRSRMPFETIFSDLGLTFPAPEIEKMLRESLANKDQLMVHVFGYNSAAAMLDAMQATGGREAWTGRRARFEHGDGLFADLVPRAREMGVIVVQNPSHLDVITIFPDLSLERAQPLRTLLSAGLPVALGSDGPMNPFLNILFASTHPDRPSESITREQSVVAYTLTSAYAEFAEKEKGSLEPGKLADLAVLTQDIFTIPAAALPETRSALTMVGGKIVYDAGVLSLATLTTANASDFWLTKDWHQWTIDECATILNDSPWTRTQDAYTVQLRSALPIREAIVRQLEIAQGYDQKTEDQRKAFDSAAGTILNTNYDKTILVRLSFSKDAPAVGPKQLKNLQPMIVTEDGQQIIPTQTDVDPMTPNAVDFYFPRLKDGVPAIKPAQKQFSFQFQAPSYVDANHATVITKLVTINFDLTKMLVEGKPNY